MARFYCKYLDMIKPSFYFSWVQAPPGLKTQLSSFSSSSSGITGFSKAQLVSSSYCLATPYSHKDFSTSLWCHLHDFVFSVHLRACAGERYFPLTLSHWRHLLFMCQSSFFSCWYGGKWKGLQGTFVLLSLATPPPQCMVPCGGIH